MEETDFRSSKDVSFARRMRSLPGAGSKAQSDAADAYVADFSSLRHDGSARFSFSLSKKVAPDLKFQVEILKGGVVRFGVDEGAILKKRFRVEDVVDEEALHLAEGVDVVSEKDCVKVTLSDIHSIIIVGDPFRVEVFNGDVIVLQLNSRDLLKIEPLRLKSDSFSTRFLCGCVPFGTQPPPEGDWEETWRSWTDTKPDGPSAVGLDITFPSSKGLYGLAERACALSLPDTVADEPYRLFNADVFGYALDDPKGLYGSVPLLLSRGERQPVAALWLNASDTFVDVVTGHVADGAVSKPNKNAHLYSESGAIDLFVLTGPSMAELYAQYARLTGFPALPPMFALGLHQSRWNYFSEDEVVEVDSGYEVSGIPCDAIWLDIEHTDGKRYTEWDLTKFPDPPQLHARLTSRGRRLVTIVDPHLKKDEDFSLYVEAKEKNLLVRGNDGSSFEGECWPGLSSWVDFSDSSSRAWWRGVLADRLHSPNLWIDMNEPAIFRAPEKTMPKDALHRGDVEHRDLHNLYGFYMQMASYEALKARASNEERPFLLTRSFFAGSQRFGAVWTGDNVSTWDHLKKSIPMILTLNLCGLSFSGADVGGFTQDPSPELLLRWVQLGAFLPFFRIHSSRGTAARELFKQDPSLLQMFKEAVDLRYSLLPYWYTLFYSSTLSGMPVVRPLWMEFPDSPVAADVEGAFMVGDAILVAPVLSDGQKEVEVPLPLEENHEQWFALSSPHSRFPANDAAPYLLSSLSLFSLPAFLRSGRIVPTHAEVGAAISTSSLRPAALRILVALDDRQEAEGSIFQDDESSFKYQSEKSFVFRRLSMSNNVLKSLAPSDEPKFHSRALVREVVVLGVAKPPAGALVTMTSVREQTSRSETPDEREGNVIHSRSTVAVMTRKFTTQKTVPLTFDAAAQSVVIRGLAVEASFDWDIKLL